MKKKGFTLIELLAVIIILAIIALIATPTILGVIEKAKKGSLQDSAYGLVQAADLYYAQYSNGKTVRFDIEDNKITTEEDYNLEYKGSIKDGTILINNKGEVTVCINDGKHAAYKNYKDTKVTVVDSKTCTVPENKYVVYLDNEATITELSNQELTQEIENLKQLIEEQNNKIETLESEKSNQTDVTNSINNLTSTHNSDISLINNRLGTTNISSIGNGTITGSINSINSNLNKLFSNVVNHETTTTVPSSGDGTLINSFTVGQDGPIYIKLMLSFGNGARGNDIAGGLTVNGVYVDRYQVSASSNYGPVISLSALVNVKKGDVIKVYAAQYSGSNVDVACYGGYRY